MDADEEYSAYVSAHWTRLVHAAMLLGCSIHEAEDLVQSTFVKCYVAWDRVTKADDKDAYVYRMLMNTYTAGHPDVGEVGHEQPVRRLDPELPVHQVRGPGRAGPVRAWGHAGDACCSEGWTPVAEPLSDGP